MVAPRIVTGLPTGVKEAGQRVDFKPDKFALAIATKGYRLWWSRAALCPCRTNDQTEQPNPTCALCSGRGRFYFLPEIGVDDASVDRYGNAIDVNDARDALIIQGIMTNATNDPQIYERLGEWVFGTSRVTVFPENQISYRDRLVAVDSTMAWSQLFKADGSSTIGVTGGRSAYGLRYPAVYVTMLRSLSTLFYEDNDYTVNDDGTIAWIVAPPAAETLLTIHYAFHPVWQVLDHVHGYRDTLVRLKTLATNKKEQFSIMPVQAMVKLDFLVEP